MVSSTLLTMQAHLHPAPALLLPNRNIEIWIQSRPAIFGSGKLIGCIIFGPGLYFVAFSFLCMPEYTLCYLLMFECYSRFVCQK